ncbi:MAG TPA: ABC transporter substrate-binding protein, partial [Gemmataceae bacterium]|nr:ABC transporter substrate-binding protein [Gemmataceae bacterium]
MKRRKLLAFLCSGLIVASLSCRNRQGDALAEITARGELRWGGDEEGGGPYIYRDPADANRRIGFEIDLMDLLCGGLGVRSTFVQGQWDDQFKILSSRGCDAIVNGYELTPGRISDYISTIPYYVYELQLFARRDAAEPADWQSLRQAKAGGGKTKIGVLRDTVADRYLTANFAEHVEVVRYSGTTEAFRDVQNGNTDGTLADTPAASFYGPQFPVRPVGPPVERGYYVIYLRPGEERLRDALNDGIRTALADGRLHAIYERYKLWNAVQASLADPAVQSKPEEMRKEAAPEGAWTTVRRYWPSFLQAAGMTIRLSVAAMPLAVALGLLV